jgi:hypothetical protein
MVEKKLPRRRAELPSFEEMDEFVARFDAALSAGLLDTHLPDLITVLDNRVQWYQGVPPNEPDPLVTAFMGRVRRFRDGPGLLNLGDYYTLLGKAYEGVVVRYLGVDEKSSEDMIRVEVERLDIESELERDVVYVIPRAAIDRSAVPDPE